MLTETKTKQILVQKTKDYSIFNVIDGNRDVNEAHVTSLIDSFNKRQLIVPIIVNKKMLVIDGQHRLEVCKRLGMPVYYIINEDYGLEEIQMLNSTQKNWSNDDYIKCYIKMGKEDYEFFRMFRKEYKLPHYVSMMILAGSERDLTAKFRSGNFKIKNMAKAIDTAKKIIDIKPYFEHYNETQFSRAMVKLLGMKNYDHSTFLQKLTFQSGKLKQQARVEDYISIIEDIYNNKNRNPQNFRIETK